MRDDSALSEQTFAQRIKETPTGSVFNSEPLHFINVPDGQAIAVATQGGLILPWAEFEELVGRVRRWYATLTEEDIELHNQERRERSTARRARKERPPQSPQRGQVY